MDGTYNLTMMTPAGKQKGSIQIKTQGSEFRGLVQFMGMKKEFSGKVSGNRFEFKGDVRVLTAHVTFQVRGRVEKGKLTAEADSNLGKYEVIGELA